MWSKTNGMDWPRPRNTFIIPSKPTVYIIRLHHMEELNHLLFGIGICNMFFYYFLLHKVTTLATHWSWVLDSMFIYSLWISCFSTTPTPLWTLHHGPMQNKTRPCGIHEAKWYFVSLFNTYVNQKTKINYNSINCTNWNVIYYKSWKTYWSHT
jgi:hypothetical protein